MYTDSYHERVILKAEITPLRKKVEEIFFENCSRNRKQVPRSSAFLLIS